MTQTSEATEFNIYGNRQDEFSYLPDWAQAEVIDYCHGLAGMMNAARGVQVVKVCADGFRITRAMLEREMRETATVTRVAAQRPPAVIGLNASANMFA